MKTVTNSWKKRIVGMTLAAAAIAGPVLTTTSAQAAPGGRWGQNDRNGRNDKRDRNNRWDYNRHEYSGVISSVQGGNQFYLTLDTGGNLRVDGSSLHLRRGLQAGRRITVHGSFSSDRSRFVATSITGVGRGGHGRRR